MIKIVNKKHYDNLVREVTNLAIESKDRDIELAKLERVIACMKDDFKEEHIENISLKRALEHIEKAEQHKKKEEVRVETKSFDKDAYIKECIKHF